MSFSGRRAKVRGLNLMMAEFFLGNQQLLSYLIRLGLFLSLELHIMSRNVNFGSHSWKQVQKNIF